MRTELTDFGYLRVAAVSPELRVGDVSYNVDRMVGALTEASGAGARVVVFPELGVTGYTCGDLFFQPKLLQGAELGLARLVEKSGELALTLVAGAPLPVGGRLYNCAFFISHGRLLGIVPKSFLPTTQEFYERRWFSSERDRSLDQLDWNGRPVPFGADLIFRAEDRPEALLGIELCEDLWAVTPPSCALAQAGATVLLNPSASPEALGKSDYRNELVTSQSARLLSGYVYASAGPGESTTDLVYSGHCLIAENGITLAESARFSFETTCTLADIDLEFLAAERLRHGSFSQGSSARPHRIVPFRLGGAAESGRDDRLLRPLSPTPFVPYSDLERDRRCHDIFELQTVALAKRLRHTGSRQVVIGLSGGLDSTLAMLVAVKTFDLLKLPRAGIVAVTMPGFGTTGRTRGNAEKLATLLGCTLRIIPIDEAVTQHFGDIGHDGQTPDITYENAQARERTQILMDVANQVGGLVIGTGDLSELALGWCTYNGDHMSMYAVNCGVPKTLVRYLVDWCAHAEFQGEARVVLLDICDTPISPELLPPDSEGHIAQKTEDQVGPYRLHDFFLYQMVRMGAPPAKVFFLARRAFEREYDSAVILKWLRVFYRRFFSQQFKRSCLPDGPKIGSVALSPRGDWRMPSDASAALWLEELEGLDP